MFEQIVGEIIMRICLFLSLALYSLVSTSSVAGEPIKASFGTLGPIKAGMTVAQAETALGKEIIKPAPHPSDVIEGGKVEGETFVLYLDGDTVDCILILDNHYITDKGVMVGDDLQKVLTLYQPYTIQKRIYSYRKAPDNEEAKVDKLPIMDQVAYINKLPMQEGQKLTVSNKSEEKITFDIQNNKVRNFSIYIKPKFCNP